MQDDDPVFVFETKPEMQHACMMPFKDSKTSSVFSAGQEKQSGHRHRWFIVDVVSSRNPNDLSIFIAFTYLAVSSLIRNHAG